MARKLAAALLLAVVPVLAGPAVAAAAPGGLGPPDPATDSGEAIATVYWVVFGICALVFVLVEAALVLFVIRFRRRPGTPETVEGPQIHGNTRLEIIWTLVPAVILLGIAVFVFARTPAVLASADEGEDPLVVRVEAHQFYWQYEYPGGALSLDTLYLPVDRPVRLELITWDVNHSWWVPELTGKRDAIAGRKNVLSFTPKRIGSYEGECAELCGVQHAVMYTRVEVVSEADFQAFVDGAESAEPAELGRSEWEAVCAKCHGLAGEGDVGPAIAKNGTLGNRQGLIELLSRGLNEPDVEGYMPPVGLGWDGRQYDALLAYIRSNPELSPAGGGG